ncbi:MAG: hypothetical protein IJT49_05120 [Clostridia bacterium]|nr:hypothetical protein [Clostridia bacterium]
MDKKNIIPTVFFIISIVLLVISVALSVIAVMILTFRPDTGTADEPTSFIGVVLIAIYQAIGSVYVIILDFITSFSATLFAMLSSKKAPEKFRIPGRITAVISFLICIFALLFFVLIVFGII